MNANRKAGGIALIAGAALYLLILAFHPLHGTGAELHGFSVGELVHAVAILAGPLFVFGFLVVAQRQGLDRWPVLMAVVFYGIGATVGLLAPTVSGLIGPRVLRAGREAGPAAADVVHAMGDVVFWLNQAAGMVHYTLMSVALLLMAAAWRGRGALDAAIRVSGLLGGAGVLAWAGFGSGRLDVHSLGLIVLALGGWHVLAAVRLLRDGPAAFTHPSRTAP